MLVLPTCLPGGLCGEVSGKLLEDVGHRLLHEQADEVGGCVELQRQRAGESTPPLLDGRLQGLTQGFHFVVCTLCGRRVHGKLENVNKWFFVVQTEVS